METEAIFARQQSIPLELPTSVLMVGAGGVGSWIAFFLALAGVPKLMLFDSDRVSEHNLNRLPYGPEFIGQLKTAALKQTILKCRPHCEVECLPNFTPDLVKALNLGDEMQVRGTRHAICVSTDTWVSRKVVYKWFSEDTSDCLYIEASAEGEFGSIATCPAEWATADEERPGYASVPVWVGPAVAAAFMACNHILHYAVRGDETARLGWSQEDNHIVFAYRGDE